MKDFKNLKIWQNGIEVSQIKRSAVSIPSNIAEGSGRNSDKDFKRFLDVALGSSFELETQLIIAQKLNYLDEWDFSNLNKQLDEVQKMIIGLQKTLTN